MAGTIVHQVIDGGAARARVHAAAADADEAEIAYRKTVLEAWGDVRTALVMWHRTQREDAGASDAVRRARNALHKGDLRHAAGAIDGAAGAQLRIALREAERARAAADAQAVDARVRLALATGGR